MKTILAMNFEEGYKYFRDSNNSGYVLISARNSGCNLFDFLRTERCKDILWLDYETDYDKEKCYRFNSYHADDVVEFIKKNRKRRTWVIVSYDNVFRARTLRYAVLKCLGLPYEESTDDIDMFVADQIIKAWEKSKQPPKPLKPVMINGKIEFVEDDNDENN